MANERLEQNDGVSLFLLNDGVSHILLNAVLFPNMVPGVIVGNSMIQTSIEGNSVTE